MSSVECHPWSCRLSTECTKLHEHIPSFRRPWSAGLRESRSTADWQRDRLTVPIPRAILVPTPTIPVAIERDRSPRLVFRDHTLALPRSYAIQVFLYMLRERRRHHDSAHHHLRLSVYRMVTPRAPFVKCLPPGSMLFGNVLIAVVLHDLPLHIRGDLDHAQRCVRTIREST